MSLEPLFFCPPAVTKRPKRKVSVRPVALVTLFAASLLLICIERRRRRMR